jgi:hypothetical protein
MGVMQQTKQIQFTLVGMFPRVQPWTQQTTGAFGRHASRATPNPTQEGRHRRPYFEQMLTQLAHGFVETVLPDLFQGLAVVEREMTTPDLFRALGHPDWFAKATLVKIVVLAVTIYPLSAVWGIVGTAVAVVLAALADIPFTLRWACQALGFRLLDLIRPLLPPLTGAMLVALVYLLGQGA